MANCFDIYGVFCFLTNGVVEEEPDMILSSALCSSKVNFPNISERLYTKHY